MYGWAGWAKIWAAGADSTARPAYMTVTRSHTRATTPKSWVM